MGVASIIRVSGSPPGVIRAAATTTNTTAQRRCSPQRTAGDNSEGCSRKQKHRELEGDPKGKQEAHCEAEVEIDADGFLENPFAEAEQNPQRERQRVIAEGDACDE